MSLELIYDILAIGGIFLEIIGFLYLIKYQKMPKEHEYNKWFQKFFKKFPHYSPNQQNSTEYWFQERRPTGLVGRINLQVPIDFVDYWEGRKDLMIILIVFGLFCQIIQIFGSRIESQMAENISNVTSILL